MAAMTHANTSTTRVRRAVATSESVSRMPSLARAAVSPANRAEPAAAAIHMCAPMVVARHDSRGDGGGNAWQAASEQAAWVIDVATELVLAACLVATVWWVSTRVVPNLRRRNAAE